MKKNKKISSKQKSLILTEAIKPGSSISEIAKTHNVTRSTIYTWLKENKKFQAIKKENLNPNNDTFVELALVDTKNYNKTNLQKASFIFNNFSFVLEGNMETICLLKILKVLEEAC